MKGQPIPVAVFIEVYGAVGLHVFEDGRDPQSFSSPSTATVTLRHHGGELPVAFDLAAAADAAAAPKANSRRLWRASRLRSTPATASSPT